ncbi:cytochrome P450 [Saccharopolyspora sp. HNM0983]|uniref:Cytochrome P450 n=1 Tax=Saccharopolyspora montiporae TaxID=2781240 RepID=A0A929FZ36_9PSEU|nr:cytochrome P450 [Saccharopolyspora sp. HNM0983]
MPLHGTRFQQNPGEMYRKLRTTHGPVAPVELEGGLPAWFVLGYSEVCQVESNPGLFARDTRRWNAWDRVPDDWPLMPFVGYTPSLMFTEGAEHRRRTGAVGDALAAVDPFELRSACEQVADGLIDEFTGSGQSDLMAQFAHPMPLRVMARLYGMADDEAGPLMQDLTDTVASDDGVAAYQRIYDRMRALVETKKQRRGPDVPSRMLDHAAGLSDEELLQDLLVVLTAAQQPVAYWIGNAIRLMLTDIRFAVTFTGGRRSVGQALTEVLWEDTPTQNFIGRFATRDTNLGGQRIRTGDMLVLGFAAANTDPHVRPDFYSDSIGNDAHLSFGHGEHGCPYPGPQTGEVIARTAIEVLLERLPDLALSVRADDLVWLPSVWMRGLAELPVQFSPGVPVR